MVTFADYNPHPWKAQDPDREKPDRKGMLLSDQIKKFCEKKLLIAEGYDETRLRPAAYTLTIGPEYRDAFGKPGMLTEQNRWYEMLDQSWRVCTELSRLAGAFLYRLARSQAAGRTVAVRPFP